MTLLERASNDNPEPKFKIDMRVALEWMIRVLCYIPRSLAELKDIYGEAKRAAEATKEGAIEAARKFRTLQKLRTKDD